MVTVCLNICILGLTVILKTIIIWDYCFQTTHTHTHTHTHIDIYTPAAEQILFLLTRYYTSVCNKWNVVILKYTFGIYSPRSMTLFNISGVFQDGIDLDQGQIALGLSSWKCLFIGALHTLAIPFLTSHIPTLVMRFLVHLLQIDGVLWNVLNIL